MRFFPVAKRTPGLKKGQGLKNRVAHPTKNFQEYPLLPPSPESTPVSPVMGAHFKLVTTYITIKSTKAEKRFSVQYSVLIH